MGLYRFLAGAIRHAGLDRRSKVSFQDSAALLNAFSPAVSNARELGFLETGHAPGFAEACSMLNVKPDSIPKSGYGRRSIGASVVDASGANYWLKVFGLTSSDNERWKTEIESDAIVDVRKPKLIEQITWKHQDEFWVARLTELAANVIEDGPFAGARAHDVTDAWLESLNRSLESLARQSCARVHVQPDLFKRWLWRHFRRELPMPASGWVASHNDLQWGNLCAPDLSILDWEWFGQSPQGYDQGMLIACSCHDDALTTRLELSFKPVFESEPGYFGKVFAAHTIRNSIRNGWLNPAMLNSVERLIERWEAQLR